MEKLVKVLLFDPYFEGKYGNARYVIDLFEHEKYLNVDLYTCSPEKPSYLNDLQKKEKFFLLELNKREKDLNKFEGKIIKKNLLKKIKILFNIVSYSLRFKNLCIKNKVDVVHCNSVRAILTIGIGAKLAKCKTVLYVKSNLSNFFFILPAFLLANNILFQTKTNQSKANVLLRFFFKKKFKILNNAIDLSRLQYSSMQINYEEVLNLKKETVNFVYMGSIVPRKGIHILLKAFNLLLKKNDVKLFFLGDQLANKNYFKKLKKIFINSKIPNSVVFLGHKEDALDVLQKMDCLVLPSLDEGLPKCVIEAKCLGKPAIVSDIGGVKEIINHQTDGYIVPVNNYSALKEAMQLYIDNFSSINISAHENKSISMNNFSFEKHCDNLSDIYLGLLK